MSHTLRRNDVEVEVVFAGPATAGPAMREAKLPGDTIIITETTNVAEARNIALEYADGDVIAQFDADDIHFPHAVDHLVDTLYHRGVSAVYGTAIDVDEDLIPQPSPTFPTGLWDVQALARFRNSHRSKVRPMGVYPLLPCAGVMRRDHMGGGWDESLCGGRYYEDNPLVLRLAAHSCILTVPTPTIMYRNHPSSLTATRAPSDVAEVEAALQKAEGQ